MNERRAEEKSGGNHKWHRDRRNNKDNDNDSDNDSSGSMMEA